MHDTDNVNDRIARAPLPSARALRKRQNLAYQAGRFVALNLRMIRMVAKGH
ncbi:hypothetical protein [Nocardioides pelophilus]|uniref:hypothetical protein n=1 Tax=Nocardioides pelophilus TaxID=2172019 RepID=UPI0016035870|nr:hypothetical protein [Nocardioides pelophilus]